MPIKLVGACGVEPHLRRFTVETRIQPVPTPMAERCGPDPHAGKGTNGLANRAWHLPS